MTAHTLGLRRRQKDRHHFRTRSHRTAGLDGNLGMVRNLLFELHSQQILSSLGDHLPAADVAGQNIRDHGVGRDPEIKGGDGGLFHADIHILPHADFIIGQFGIHLAIRVDQRLFGLLEVFAGKPRQAHRTVGGRCGLQRHAATGLIQKVRGPGIGQIDKYIPALKIDRQLTERCRRVPERHRFLAQLRLDLGVKDDVDAMVPGAVDREFIKILTVGRRSTPFDSACYGRGRDTDRNSIAVQLHLLHEHILKRQPHQDPVFLRVDKSVDPGRHQQLILRPFPVDGDGRQMILAQSGQTRVRIIWRVRQHLEREIIRGGNIDRLGTGERIRRFPEGDIHGHIGKCRCYFSGLDRFDRPQRQQHKGDADSQSEFCGGLL